MWNWFRWQSFRIFLGLMFIALLMAVWLFSTGWWLIISWVYFHTSYHKTFVVLLIMVTAYLFGMVADDNL